MKKTYVRLKGLLKSFGFEQSDVAKLLDTSVSSVSRRYRAVEPWDIDQIYKLMDAIHEPYENISEFFPRGGITPPKVEI